MTGETWPGCRLKGDSFEIRIAQVFADRRDHAVRRSHARIVAVLLRQFAEGRWVRRGGRVELIGGLLGCARSASARTFGPNSDS